MYSCLSVCVFLITLPPGKMVSSLLRSLYCSCLSQSVHLSRPIQLAARWLLAPHRNLALTLASRSLPLGLLGLALLACERLQSLHISEADMLQVPVREGRNCVSCAPINRTTCRDSCDPDAKTTRPAKFNLVH